MSKNGKAMLLFTERYRKVPSIEGESQLKAFRLQQTHLGLKELEKKS